MQPDWIPFALLALLVLLILLTLWLALRRNDAGPIETLRGDVRQLERELRDELARSATGTRTELAQTLASLQQTLLAQQGDVARTQNEQIDSFRTQLAATQQHQADTLGRSGEQQALALKRFSELLIDQLRALSQSNDQRMAEVRTTVEQKLTAIQLDNEKKLEQMRATVDEKLHATLEQRLGESFKQVADRLEQVHRGLGEMQGLAKDVGSLSRVLNNVKSRGNFGEVQLGALLEEVFTAEQFSRNVETIPDSNARVDFALRLPGRRDDGAPLWLPIDAKFPREDYERLLEAQERADPVAAEIAGRAIEMRLRAEARTIREKYIAAPHTTDFGILFVPTEGLYAEALRRPGLVETLQREHKIMLAGPTTLLATLNSLQMGFRTLALEKRSAEVWEKLGAVKTEFAKFGDVLAKTKKKLDEASSSIDMAERRTRVMARELKSVEALSDSRAQMLLPGAEAELADDESA
jgi:DNA recombination protein RmuC